MARHDRAQVLHPKTETSRGSTSATWIRQGLRELAFRLTATLEHKLELRIERRVIASGLVERKTREAFDWDFQPNLDKALVDHERHSSAAVFGAPPTLE